MGFPDVRGQCNPLAFDALNRLREPDLLRAERPRILYALADILRRDFPSYAALMLKVKPKGGGLLKPFVFNQAQRIVWRRMATRMRNRLPLFITVLKARQEGISTFCCGWNHWQLWRQKDIQTMTVAHSQKTAETMIETMRVFHDELPDYTLGDFRFKPELREGNHGATVPRGELYYADRRCWNLIHVAKNFDPRGQQVTHVHETEHSKFPDADELNGALLPALPPFGSEAILQASFIIESTPAGENAFYHQYMLGKDETQKLWSSIFIPWFCLDEEYAAAMPAGEQLTADELLLQTQYSNERAKIDGHHVSDAQMYWRRVMINSYYKGDQEKFDQEYPCDDISCFNLRSKGIFRHVTQAVYMDNIKGIDLAKEAWRKAGASVNGPVRGRMDYTKREYFYQAFAKPKFTPDVRGKLCVWVPPVAGHVYCIGGDVAAGTDEGDFSSMCVIDVTGDGWQVAEFMGRLQPEHYADTMAALGTWYNNALLIPEVNGLGYVVLQRLGANIIYPNLFRWPRWDEIMSYTKKKGWETNERTKVLAISRAVYVLEEGLVHVTSPTLREQLTVYQQINDPGSLWPRYGAPRGSHDDLVIAFALSVMGILQTPKLAATLKTPDVLPTTQQLGISAAPQVTRPLTKKVDPAEEIKKINGGSVWHDAYPWNPLADGWPF